MLTEYLGVLRLSTLPRALLELAIWVVFTSLSCFVLDFISQGHREVNKLFCFTEVTAPATSGERTCVPFLPYESQGEMCRRSGARDTISWAPR